MATNESTWSRLRWPIKAIIIAAPIIFLIWFAASRGLINKPSLTNNTEATTSDTRSSNDNNEAADTKSSTSHASATKNNNSRSFAYVPEKPVNGTLKGVVEVGATGFNSFIINIDNQKRWEIVSKDFGESLAYEGMATTDDIRAGLKKYISNMFDRGVTSRNIHFVISSGAQKVPKTGEIVTELKKMGYVVNLVTPEQEGKFGLKSVQPQSYQDNSFVADIGSGNTKVSWYQNGILKTLELPGAKYYEHNTPDEDIYNEVKSKAGAIPKANTDVCFIIGGVPFELAKQIRQGEERYTVLNLPSEYKTDKQKTKSGITIYKALADATGCDTFVFDWDANFTIGFLLSLPS